MSTSPCAPLNEKYELKQLVAERFASSFGKSGEFTVIVEEANRKRDEAQDESSLHCAEFRVSAWILSCWSEVFGKMMSDDFIEGKKKEVVIKDFSAEGVEAFLCFFYTGTLDISQVDVIVEEALAQRPSVSDELLEEVLSSGLLCISDGELFSLLAKWKEAEEGLKNIELIEKHVNMQNVPPELVQQSGLDDESLRPLKTRRLTRSRGEETEDVHGLLRRRFEEFLKGQERPVGSAHQPNPVEGCSASWNFGWGEKEGRSKAMWEANFLTDWVQVSHTMSKLPGSPYSLACNQRDVLGPFLLDAGTWVEWRLLRFALYLTGISLTGLEAAHVEIWCGDGARWERIFCSEGKEIKVKTSVCSQCGQDGVLRTLFQNVGFRASKEQAAPFYVEFGARKPGMLNSAVLREFCGWQGILLDSQPGETPHGGCRDCPGVAEIVKTEFVTAENIVELFRKYDVPRDFDLLTIDTDYNDYWIWRALLTDGTFRPRVVAVDFNPDLPLHEAKAVRYSAMAEWDGTVYTVGSLLAYALVARAHGYSFAYALEMGSHAFFIRSDLLHEEDIDLPLPGSEL
eukprot:symbB.v1.2.006656.t1/scaffold372.1/size218212/8